MNIVSCVQLSTLKYLLYHFQFKRERNSLNTAQLPMKKKDLSESADDRQLFVVFPSEIDDLLSLTESGDYDAWTGKYLMAHYLFDRRKGAGHGDALVNAKRSLSLPQIINARGTH